MPANTNIIPLKAIYSGGYTGGDVIALGELNTGDKLDPTFIDLSNYMAVANVTGNYVLTSTFNSALANTNSYIATTAATELTHLANTNAYIASVSATERSALANTNAYIATKEDIGTGVAMAIALG